MSGENSRCHSGLTNGGRTSSPLLGSTRTVVKKKPWFVLLSVEVFVCVPGRALLGYPVDSKGIAVYGHRLYWCDNKRLLYKGGVLHGVVKDFFFFLVLYLDWNNIRYKIWSCMEWWKIFFFFNFWVLYLDWNNIRYKIWFSLSFQCSLKSIHQDTFDTGRYIVIISGYTQKYVQMYSYKKYKYKYRYRDSWEIDIVEQRFKIQC